MFYHDSQTASIDLIQENNRHIDFTYPIWDVIRLANKFLFRRKQNFYEIIIVREITTIELIILLQLTFPQQNKYTTSGDSFNYNDNNDDH